MQCMAAARPLKVGYQGLQPCLRTIRAVKSDPKSASRARAWIAFATPSPGEMLGSSTPLAPGNAIVSAS
jgi:hypothetical protein